MAKEITIARESGAISINNAVKSTLSRSRLKGWNNTYAPKNQKVKVLDWLKDNDFHTDEHEKDVLGDMTFRDVLRGADYDNLDTLERDAVYVGASSLKRKR